MSESAIREAVRVLVVEDHEDYRCLVQRFFERANCEVVTADSAEAALAIYSELDPHVAVVDLVLPGMNGWQLSELLTNELPNCAVAVSSSLDTAHYPGFVEHLPKPISRFAVTDLLSRRVPHWEGT